MTRRRTLLVVVGVFSAFGLWIALGIVGALVVTSRVPVKLPSFSISDSATFLKYRFVMARGTWTLESDAQAFPLQTTKIQCDRDSLTCTVATAEVSFGDMLSV